MRFCLNNNNKGIKIGYVQVDIDPESVIDAMNADSEFAMEMWVEIAGKLETGMLLDNACDIFENHERNARHIADIFESFAGSLRSRHLSLCK